SDQERGKLAQIVVKNLEGKKAVVIDASGNATFSGTLVANSLQINSQATISGTLFGEDASFSGQLMAKEITSETIDRLTQEIETSQADINEIQQLLSQIRNQPLPNPQNQTNLSQTLNFDELRVTNLRSQSAITDTLTVLDQTNLYRVTISHSLLAGRLLLEDNSIISLGSELKLSALSSINLFEDKVIIAKNGNITTQGEIIAQKGVKTNKIQPLSQEDDLEIRLTANETRARKLSIKNQLEEEVASIDASGSAFFKNLSLEKFTPATPSSVIIAASENFERNRLFAPAIETETASAGIGVIPVNQREVVIYNDNIKKDSLIYLTPSGNVQGQLSIAEKKDCANSNSYCRSYFRVINSIAEAQPVKFDWLIIN
ncbi:MAG: hypothetical protein NZL96_03890, partial [Patescibacteria group bacterium]|nr:hypothetical protein [Patescibacteria group bacterium]